MKSYKTISLLLILIFINIKCSENELNTDEKSNDYQIITIFEKEGEVNLNQNSDLFPEVLKIEKIGNKTEIASNLLSTLNDVELASLDLSEIERLTLSNKSQFIYSIPFQKNNSKMIIATDGRKFSIVIAKEESNLKSNKKYIVKNRNEENLFTVEQNSDNNFGNYKQFKNENGYYKANYTFPYSNVKFQNTNFQKSNCLLENPDSFSDCMQCGWEECSSSWVCGAILAIRPVEVIATAAALCGLNTLANLR